MWFCKTSPNIRQCPGEFALPKKIVLGNDLPFMEKQISEKYLHQQNYKCGFEKLLRIFVNALENLLYQKNCSRKWFTFHGETNFWETDLAPIKLPLIKSEIDMCFLWRKLKRAYRFHLKEKDVEYNKNYYLTR